MEDLTAYAIDSEYIRSLNRLFIELQDLKRQQPAHLEKSIASSFFIESWKLLSYGKTPKSIALSMTTKGLLSIVLPGCDRQFFTTAGLNKTATEQILLKAFTENIEPKLTPDFANVLIGEIPDIAEEFTNEPIAEFNQTEFENKFWFVETLCRQPRAGATKPGEARLLLTPAEMHSDHCMLTALYAVLLSAGFNTDPGLPFLTGLSHHLHNAVLPDCGFAGEIALGDQLEPILDNARKKALEKVSPELKTLVEEAINNHENLGNAAGKASSAADVLDRVIDIKWRVRAASVTEKDVLDDLELVHEGPIQNFQTEILKSAGL